MKLILLPLLFSVAYLGFENRDKIIDQYNAAYPRDPRKEAALERCIAEARDFNRLDADDRDGCYRRHLERIVAVIPDVRPIALSALSTSHLPADDIRRQQANDGYQRSRAGRPADTAPIAAAPAAAARTIPANAGPRRLASPVRPASAPRP